MSTVEQIKTAPVRTPEGLRTWWAPKTWWDGGREFLAEVRNETRRVTWPSRREVYATTFVVIATSVFFGVYLWGLDLAFDRLVGWIFRQFGA